MQIMIFISTLFIIAIIKDLSDGIENSLTKDIILISLATILGSIIFIIMNQQAEKECERIEKETLEEVEKKLFKKGKDNEI